MTCPKSHHGRNSIMAPLAETGCLQFGAPRAVLLGPGPRARGCNEAADSDIGEGWS